jgi:uncharacterized protein YcfJ
MHTHFKKLLVLTGVALAAQSHAAITLYERNAFDGRSVTLQDRTGNFDRLGMNDSARSIVVDTERWEVCDDARFSGHCVVLRPGRYPNLRAVGMGDRISSARPLPWGEEVSDARMAPPPPEYHGWVRQEGERLTPANIVDVHAVVGPPEQRCWVDRQQYYSSRGDNVVPGAITGAVIGNIIGHQFGAGGQTAGGLAGAAIGAQVGAANSPGVVTTRDIQHCRTTSNSAVDFWDVTYMYGGVEHHVQMTTPPNGATILVNERGEPRQQ